MCVNSPCLNAGVCTSSCPTFTCSCPSCWTGENCEIGKFGSLVCMIEDANKVYNYHK